MRKFGPLVALILVVVQLAVFVGPAYAGGYLSGPYPPNDRCGCWSVMAPVVIGIGLYLVREVAKELAKEYVIKPVVETVKRGMERVRNAP